MSEKLILQDDTRTSILHPRFIELLKSRTSSPIQPTMPTMKLIISFLALAAAPLSLAWAPQSSGVFRRTASMSAVEKNVSVMEQSNSRRQFLGTSTTAAVAAVLATASPAYAKGPKNSVSFSNVKDGDTVPPKFTYKFEVEGFELLPASAGNKEGSGHHHLVVDNSKAFVDKGEAIPFDGTHKHYGKAQTEGELELLPGKHKLTLRFANANHESYGKEMAKTITVNVKDV
jgi:hypothetical protein